MTNIFKSTKIFLIGLTILLSCSLPILGGGKPKIEKVTSTVRSLSGKEIKQLIDSNPIILNDALGKGASNGVIAIFKKMDTTLLKANLGIKEIENSFLRHFFPNAHFYQSIKLDIKPPHPYMIAIIGNKLYQMPYEFNWLLLRNKLKVNDRNIIELAKTFVIIALVGHEIIFLESKRIREERMIGTKKNITYTAQLKVQIGDEIRNWHLPQDIYKKNQFGGATLKDKDDKVMKIFQLLVIETNQK
jgi:hypothetical protein